MKIESTHFIYSYHLDITNSFQRSFDKGPSDAPLCQQVDSRFWWNEHMQSQFKDAKVRRVIHTEWNLTYRSKKLDEWIIPVMQGTMQIEACKIEDCRFDFIVISRRSRERAGMRYQRRGVNEQGQVANFVETEQIIIFEVSMNKRRRNLHFIQWNAVARQRAACRIVCPNTRLK